MSKHFDTHVMSKYAELCVMWRMELVSCRSNAEDINAQLSSLEEVIKAFGIGAPGLPAESEPLAKREPEQKAQDTQPEPKAEEPKPRAEEPKARAEEPKPRAEEPKPRAEEPKPRSEVPQPRAEVRQPQPKPQPKAEELEPEELQLQPRRRDKIPQPRRAEPELVEV